MTIRSPGSDSAATGAERHPAQEPKDQPKAANDDPTQRNKPCTYSVGERATDGAEKKVCGDTD